MMFPSCTGKQKGARQAVYYERRNEPRSRYHFLSWGKNKYYILSLCVCNLVFLAYSACLLFYVVICSSVSWFSSSDKWNDFRKIIKKSYWAAKCEFWFSLQLLSEIFLILERFRRYLSQTYIGINAEYSLFCGPGGSVGIATGYGLGGPGIESRWGRDFPHLSRPALRPT